MANKMAGPLEASVVKKMGGAKPNSKAPLGQGGRFAALVQSGKSPALAAYIGRKKYGAKAFGKLSAKGR